VQPAPLTLREPSADDAGKASARVAPEVEGVAIKPEAANDSTHHLAVVSHLPFYQRFWANLFKAIEQPERVMTAADYPRARFLAPIAASLDNYFYITHRGSTFWTEFVGGMTTFFAMVYILVLNGVIIGGTGITRESSFFSTALSSGIFTLLMGVVAGLPVALAPGMVSYARQARSH
jgi:hypothetical protein